MEQNFSLMAQSRANYYTAGSPVQFVRVELLKGDQTGEIAVCLTFKNVSSDPLTGLVVRFKCKDTNGEILCEDDFYYEDLQAGCGDLFGTDDAVYISDKPISSVEVELDRAFLDGRGVDLRPYKRVRLKMPRRLPKPIVKTLRARTGNNQLICVPQDVEAGWFCACGGFHPNQENARVCTECGADRAEVKETLTQILMEAQAAAEQRETAEIPAVTVPDAPTAEISLPAAAAPAEQPAVAEPVKEIVAPVQKPAEPEPAEEPEEELTKAIPAQKSTKADPLEDEEEEPVREYSRKHAVLHDDDSDAEDITQMFDAEDDEEETPRGRYADDDDENDEDVMAERIIHWAPPITAILCALIIAAALIYHFVVA